MSCSKDFRLATVKTRRDSVTLKNVLFTLGKEQISVISTEKTNDLS